MIARFSTPEERRRARLMFFKDDVYVIAHKALQEIPCSLCVEEIFCSAERLAHHLLTHGITDRHFMDYEIDDLTDACDDGDALFLTLTVTYVKLCALRKANTMAGEVARALVHRCQAYEGFTELLGELAKAEHQLVVDKGRIDLLAYELKTMEKEMPDAGKINDFVNSALECSVKVIENVIVAFSNFNETQNHRYDMQQSVLTQGYKDKQDGKPVSKIELNFNNTVGMVVAHTDQVNSGHHNHE